MYYSYASCLFSLFFLNRFCFHSVVNLTNEKPQSCREIKLKKFAALDGEYDLWYSSNSTYIKIYCHNMSVDPTEYLSLPAGGESNYICKGEGSNPAKYGPPCCGKFRKVRLIITSIIQILRTDTTFMTPSDSNCSPLTAKAIIGYGSAGGCNKVANGNFKIDLTGTLHRISMNVSWVSQGYQPKFTNYHISSNGRIVSAYCGGHCGHCNPTSGYTLPLELADKVHSYTF